MYHEKGLHCEKNMLADVSVRPGLCSSNSSVSHFDCVYCFNLQCLGSESTHIC